MKIIQDCCTPLMMKYAEKATEIEKKLYLYSEPVEEYLECLSTSGLQWHEKWPENSQWYIKRYTDEVQIAGFITNMPTSSFDKTLHSFG
jgi:hypothetical protein